MCDPVEVEFERKEDQSYLNLPTNLTKQDSVTNSIKGFRGGNGATGVGAFGGVNAAELLKNKTFSMEEHS